LREWSDDKKIVWNCIEASRISNTKVKPTPAQIRSEVWMSIIAGSRGLIYFVHQFEPQFREASLLDDPDLLAEVTRLNREIQTLAPALNSASLPDRISVKADRAKVKSMYKEIDGKTYLFLANHTAEPVAATVQFKDQILQNAEYFERLSNTSGRLTNQELAVALEQYGVAVYQLTPRKE
jgi:hypothetical protein